MSDGSDDITQLDDPAFIAERRRVLCQAEKTPEGERSPELRRLVRAVDQEFLRRASLAWQPAAQPEAPAPRHP
jgi:hypothetical protein